MTSTAAQTTNDLSFQITAPTDHASLQLALMELLQRIAANQIDMKRAGLMLRILSMIGRSLNTLAREARAANAASKKTAPLQKTTTSSQPASTPKTTDVSVPTQRDDNRISTPTYSLAKAAFSVQPRSYLSVPASSLNSDARRASQPGIAM